jgi:hypothetical protein
MYLYHWHVEAGGKKADYLCMAEDVADARKALITNIRTPGGAVFAQAGHDAFIAANRPTFIAGVDYPIVLW